MAEAKEKWPLVPKGAGRSSRYTSRVKTKVRAKVKTTVKNADR